MSTSSITYTRRPKSSGAAAAANEALSTAPPETQVPALPEFLTIKMVSEILGCDVTFLRTQFNRFPGVLRIGNSTCRKKTLIPRQVFERWIEKNTVKEGGAHGVTFKRHRKTLAARRPAKKLLQQDQISEGYVQ